jgi:hypothetical protein
MIMTFHVLNLEVEETIYSQRLETVQSKCGTLTLGIAYRLSKDTVIGLKE